MTTTTVATFTFSSEIQKAFATLSGDWNPMHMDAVAARRTQSGRPVVHGMHTALRALDGFAASSLDAPLPAKLTVRFPTPVYVDDKIAIGRVDSADRQLRLQVRVDGTLTADLRLVVGDSPKPVGDSGPYDVNDQAVCPELTLKEMINRTGTVRLAKPIAEVAAQFPNAARWLGADRVAALLCLSRLVGMECPGLHSLFSGFTLEFPREASAHALEYNVASVDEHFRLLNIEVRGLGVRGTVEAFARYPPVSQLPIQDLSKLVGRKDFAGHRVLIIGGSRGLGELTAKFIAAGGGHPVITYAVGSADAERVVAEIKKWGAECDLLKCDVRLPALPQLASVAGSISHLYYYATPQIFGRKTREFSAAILEEFLEFYVRGFYNICAALRESSKQPVSVFYPSSIAVEERPRNMTEYAMAKGAAEVLCVDLNRAWTSIHITTARLPRLLTDQTSTVAATESADSVATILPIVREVQSFKFQP